MRISLSSIYIFGPLKDRVNSFFISSGLMPAFTIEKFEHDSAASISENIWGLERQSVFQLFT